jgi:uncharacterized protein
VNLPACLRHLALATGVALAGIPVAQAVPVPERPQDGFLADPAHLVAEGPRTALENWLRAFTKRRGSQLVVIVVPATEPEPIADFAQRAFTTWKPGRKGVDDGVLVVIAPGNRLSRLRIHTGYGLEGAIPDVVAKRVLVEKMQPALAAEGATGAVGAAVDALLDAFGKSPALTAPKDKNVIALDDRESRLATGILAMVVLLVVAGLVLPRCRGPRLRKGTIVLLAAAACGLYAWIGAYSIFLAGAVAWIALGVHGFRRVDGWVPGDRDVQRRLVAGLPLAIAAISFAGCAVAFGFSGGGIAFAVGWAAASALLACMMNGLLRPGRGGWDSGGGSDSPGGSSDSSGDSGGDSGGGGASE